MSCQTAAGRMTKCCPGLLILNNAHICISVHETEKIEQVNFDEDRKGDISVTLNPSIQNKLHSVVKHVVQAAWAEYFSMLPEHCVWLSIEEVSNGLCSSYYQALHCYWIPAVTTHSLCVYARAHNNPSPWWSMGLFSFIQECGLSVWKHDLLISVFLILCLKIPPSYLNSPCSCISAYLLCFCSALIVACIDFLLLLQHFTSHSGCICALVKRLLSYFCSALGFFFSVTTQSKSPNQ